MTPRLGPLRGGLVVVAVLAATATGCGDDQQTPADEVPALATTLRTVDTAIAGHHYGRARQLLQDLVTATEQARDDDRISEAAADRILAAVARLVTALPEATPTPTPTPTTSTPTPKPRPEKPDKHDDHPRKGKKHDKHDKHD